MSLNATRTRRLDHALDTLWYIISAPQVTAALFVLLALILGLAAVLPQAPAGLEAAEADRWLTTAAGRFPGAGIFLRSVGAFNLLDSPWAYTLMAVLALNLLLRIAAQARFLSRKGQPPLPPERVTSRRAALAGPLPSALSRLQAALGQDYTVSIESDAERAQIFAQRRPAGAFAPLLIYGGLLVLLAGLAVDGAIGWRAAGIALAPGNTALLNRAGAPQITLNQVAGEGLAARADVTLAHMGRSNSLAPRLAQPARWGNLWLVQKATGPALAVTATDPNGRALVVQALGPDDETGPTVHVLFAQTQSEQGFAVPTRNLTFRVVSYTALPEQGISAPVFLLEAYRGDAALPAATELIEEDGSLQFDNVTLALRRDRYVILEAAYLPGLLPMLLGSLLTLAGIILMTGWGMTRVWVQLAADGDQVLAIVGAAGPAEPHTEIERVLHAARQPDAPNAGAADAV